MQVKILEHTPNPERLIAASAKLCYSDCGIDEITEGLTTTNTEMFLGKLIDMGHESPLEHASFTFGIEGVSRALSHQLVRHRIASYSQKSQRYVSEKRFEYVIPPDIKMNIHTNNSFIRTMETLAGRYEDMAKSLTNRYIDSGMSQSDAEKKGFEDARYLLPNACTTSIVVTMNVRILLHFFNKRCCNRAQWEIREMAEQMLLQCKQVAPILFKNAGAPCASGECPEGPMGCKK